MEGFLFTGADPRAVHALSVPEFLRLHVRVVVVPDAVRHSLTASGRLPDIRRPALRGLCGFFKVFFPRKPKLNYSCAKTT